MTLTDADLDALTEAESKMTPGPWHAPGPDDDLTTWFAPVDNHANRTDAAGIVALRNIAPALLAEVRRLRAALTAAREHVEAAESALAAHMIEAAEWRDATWSLTPAGAMAAHVRACEANPMAMELRAARLDATTCRAVAVEAIGMIEHLDRRERRCRKVDLDIEYNKGRIGSPGDEDDCDCAISTLRARLTSLDPAPVRAAIDALDEAAYDHGEKILGGHDEFRAARDGRRAARADLLRLLGLEAP